MGGKVEGWVAKIKGWVAKSVARQLDSAVLWVRTSKPDIPQKSKMDDISGGVADTL
jgi:hypothetical protein